MIAIRRVYLYVLAAVSLFLLTQGLSELGRTLVEVAVDVEKTVVANRRDTVALNGALVTLGLVGWLLHWGWAQRAGRRDVRERAAVLRRLFVYAIQAVMVLTAANALQAVLEGAFRLVAGDGAPPWSRLLSPLPRLVVALAFWTYYRSVAASDRAAAGEVGGSATFRRWYVYGVAFIGQMVLLAHARSVLRTVWELAFGTADRSVVSGGGGIIAPAATALVGLLLWALHWRLQPGARHTPTGSARVEDDSRSTLRHVYAFGSLAVAVATTLFGGWQMVFYAAGRAMGVERPGGVGGGLARALAGPASLVLLYGVSWLYHRRAIRLQAGMEVEAPRQVGVRRIYVYLVALVALGVLAAGAGGLLWTLADALSSAPRTINAGDWWREQTSLNASLILVGLPVWLLHWGPVSRAKTPDAAGSLARRIYVYLTLLAAALALLGAGVTIVYQLYLLALGAAATAGVVTTLARALAVATVSALVAAYHVRVLRGDLAVAGHAVGTTAEPEAAAPEAFPRGLAPDQPSEARTYGVISRRAGVESSAWFANATQAAGELARLKQTVDALEWATVVVTVMIPAPDEAPPGDPSPSD